MIRCGCGTRAPDEKTLMRLRAAGWKILQGTTGKGKPIKDAQCPVCARTRQPKPPPVLPGQEGLF